MRTISELNDEFSKILFPYNRFTLRDYIGQRITLSVDAQQIVLQRILIPDLKR
jgi:hypothetical protein